jgi:hypothetical protein
MKYLYEELPAVEVAGTKLVGRMLFGLLVLGSALIGACVGLLIVYSTDLPEISELENYRPSSITEIYDDKGREVGSFAIQRRVIVTGAHLQPQDPGIHALHTDRAAFHQTADLHYVLQPDLSRSWNVWL